MASPHEDAKHIRKAIEGLGTDDSALVEIITNRTNEQLQLVAAEYSAAFNKSIIEDIKHDTSGHYRELLVGLVEPKPVYIARIIHEAVKGAGTNEGAIIDCLVHQPNGLIRAAHQAYHQIYNKSLVEDVVDDTSGDFKKILVALLNANRDENPQVNVEQAKVDAEHLYKKGEGKIGTDEHAFIEFFSTRSYWHIREVDHIYEHKYKHDLATAIDKEFSGWIKETLKALAVPREAYWASRIYGAISGLGTNDSRLVRAFILNDRPQLRAIADFYGHVVEKHKGKKSDRSCTGTLKDDIKGDTSGWYEKTLLALL